jgi:hypothetical protein
MWVISECDVIRAQSPEMAGNQISVATLHAAAGMASHVPHVCEGLLRGKVAGRLLEGLLVSQRGDERHQPVRPKTETGLRMVV